MTEVIICQPFADPRAWVTSPLRNETFSLLTPITMNILFNIYLSCLVRVQITTLEFVYYSPSLLCLFMTLFNIGYCLWVLLILAPLPNFDLHKNDFNAPLHQFSSALICVAQSAARANVEHCSDPLGLGTCPVVLARADTPLFFQFAMAMKKVEMLMLLTLIAATNHCSQDFHVDFYVFWRMLS